MTIRDFIRAVAQYRLCLVAVQTPGPTAEIRTRLRDSGYRLDQATAILVDEIGVLELEVGKAIVEGEAIIHDLKRQGMYESATYLKGIVDVLSKVRSTIDDPAPSDEGRAAA